MKKKFLGLAFAVAVALCGATLGGNAVKATTIGDICIEDGRGAESVTVHSTVDVSNASKYADGVMADKNSVSGVDAPVYRGELQVV